MSSYPSSGSPRRTAANEIVLYLSPTQPAPTLPFELHGSISPDVWATRVPIIAKTAARYSKPTFERIWLVMGILSLFIVPMVLQSVIFREFLHKAGNVDSIDLRLKVNMITGGVFTGLLLVIFLPIMIWKTYGRIQMNRLLKRWTIADHKNGLSSSSVSDWRVRTPGVFTTSTVLTIKLPPNVQPSTFHPDAYLPSYINGAIDADAHYYYPYKSNEPGLPRMSVVGNVPLYANEKAGFHDLKV